MTVQFTIGLLLSALVAGLGYWRRALAPSGVLGAILVGTLIFWLGGWIWGLLLITFFVSSSWLSQYRRATKERVADRFAKGSQRDLGQALANGGLGAVLAILYSQFHDPVFFAAFLGVMAAVNADTWATELGILSPVPPRLITTGQPVPTGTSGGLTWLGTWASVAGALLIGAVATALTQIQSLVNAQGWNLAATSYPVLALMGGVTGSVFDSLFGASVQGIYYCDRCAKETESPIHRCGQPTRLVRGRRWLNNDVVNFLSSLIGGLVAALMAWLLWR